ncbi:MAG: hypothetical protein Pg6C_18320 [Treponemataceae bacterium]|nr:MAG: hypothetical protein Pg6C_18320 [Treponemataceae bacterium]
MNTTPELKPCVYTDTSSKGKNGKRHNCYRADVVVNRVRHRKRGRDYFALVLWARDKREDGKQ